jgi:Ca-activated chloride channel family protein
MVMLLRRRTVQKCVRVLNRGAAAIVPFLAVALTAGVVRAQFASGVNLVEVYATVTDARGEPVTGLTSADFTVAEDGKPQAVTTFAAGEFPVAVALAIDRSFSMTAERLGWSKAAARRFIAALRSTDEALVLAIGSQVETIAPLVSAPEAARTPWDAIDTFGTTALYDATMTALDAIQTAKGRRALVLLSDGTDRFSRATASEMLDAARRKDVLVYPIAVGGAQVPVFAELAAVTGGRSFAAKNARELETALTTIARELRMQYLLGYTPAREAASASEPAVWRSIQVSVNRPGVRIRARDGYYSR